MKTRGNNLSAYLIALRIFGSQACQSKASYGVIVAFLSLVMYLVEWIIPEHTVLVLFCIFVHHTSPTKCLIPSLWEAHRLLGRRGGLPSACALPGRSSRGIQQPVLLLQLR